MTLLVVLSSLLLAWRLSDFEFRLLYRTPKSLSGDHVYLFAVVALVLVCGMTVTAALQRRTWSRVWPALDEGQLQVVERAARVCFWLTIVGYVSMLVAGLARGISLADLTAAVVQQDNYTNPLKSTFRPIPGVTTLTQVGIAYVVLGGVLLTMGRRDGVRVRVAVVLGLALLRAFFLSERLALIEVVVPLVVLLAVAAHRRGDWRPALAPALAAPVLAVLFGAFEYSRSWQFFRSRTTSSFPEFALDRLAGYYATAYNNGALALEGDRFPGRLPYGTVQGFWTAPGVEQVGLYRRLSGGWDPNWVYNQVLLHQGNPEFNNPCGLCAPLVDYGVVGGLFVALLTGALVGICYAAFRAGTPAGILLFPIVFTGLLELPRYFYWTQGRLVPALVALAVVLWQLRQLPRATGVSAADPLARAPAAPAAGR